MLFTVLRTPVTHTKFTTKPSPNLICSSKPFYSTLGPRRSLLGKIRSHDIITPFGVSCPLHLCFLFIHQMFVETSEYCRCTDSLGKSIKKFL